MKDSTARRREPVIEGKSPARLAAPGGTYLSVLRAGDLFADHRYQRPLDQRQVDRLVTDFDFSLVGIIEVSAREGGRYAIVDGQHRWAALVDLDARREETPVACHVHPGLTIEQEAAIFRRVDSDRRRLTKTERWHADLTAGDPDAIAIFDVITSRGLQMSAIHLAMKGVVRGLRACEEIYSRGGEGLLGAVLDTVLDAWGDGCDSFTPELLLGIALIQLNFPDVDPGLLLDQLGDLTPTELLARAEGLSDTRPGGLPRRVAAAVVELYNRGPGAKLAELPSRRRLGNSSKHRTIVTAKQTELAERRREVAELTRQGHSAAAIATRLGIHQRQVVRDRQAERASRSLWES